MLERLMEEIKRRTLAVRMFPNTAACLRLVRALAVETHENWIARTTVRLRRLSKNGKSGRESRRKKRHDVVLAGNDRDRLDRLSAEMGLSGVQVGLDAPLAPRKLIRKAACIIHVAGPFVTTFRPMLEACSAEGLPYLDLNGELHVFRAMEALLASAGRPSQWYRASVSAWLRERVRRCTPPACSQSRIAFG
jgi:hypothetical protein